MPGYVLLSGVELAPGIEPAERPSHSYRNRNALGAGCSVIFTKAFGYGLEEARAPWWLLRDVIALILPLFIWVLGDCCEFDNASAADPLLNIPLAQGSVSRIALTVAQNERKNQLTQILMRILSEMNS